MNLTTPKLPYDPQVDTFGDRILELDSIKLTYNQACENPTYIDRALDIENASNTGIPIEFTQFVLRKMAVDEVDREKFQNALDPRATQFLMKLIGPQNSEERQVHPANLKEGCSLFRSLFVKSFCIKLFMNLQNKNCEYPSTKELARVFPFQVSENVPEYEIDILENFDDRFYNRMERFLDEHFDEELPVRETIELFLKNIRHFFDTKYSSEQQSTEYFSKFPKLNDKGIAHFRHLYDEYKNVRMRYPNCQRRFPKLYYRKEDFWTLPKKNMEELGSLLQPIEFLKKPENYYNTFRKYLFFFVHIRQSGQNRNHVFFIDDMLYQCLRSSRKFRTLREDPMNMLEDLAMITLLWLSFRQVDRKNRDCYSIDLKTLQNIKEYITNLVSCSDNTVVEINSTYLTDLYCRIPFRINNTICFDVSYAGKKRNCQRGIMYLLNQLIRSVCAPGDERITNIVCYSPYLGRENRFVITEDIAESVRNFIRLSTKVDISKISKESLEPMDNVYLDLLQGSLTITETYF